MNKHTICILGGTPSTSRILDQIPDSLKNLYNFISFNRPGFGGSENAKLTKKKLFQLAKKAGLKENDFGIIGVSGGAPLALLLASKFKLKHCGIISGMVSNEAYFKYADSTFTKDIMKTAQQPFEQFEQAALGFPNIDDIVIQAGAPTREIAIRACYNELNFILSERLSSSLDDKSISIDWWHGEKDKNVAIQSVEFFLMQYKKARLHKINEAAHGIDARIYIGKIIEGWEK